MREVWSDRRRFEHWLRIEILAAEAWAETGRVPRESLPAIRGATFDLEKIAEVEDRVGHDVIAFLTVVGESIGADSRFLHLGMTSSDVLDTALALQLREAAALIIGDLEKVHTVAVELAIRHRRTLMPGRTHGIHAEPITFGFKVAGWVAELERALERLGRAKAEISVGKLSGAVGTHATIPPEIEERVLGELGLAVDPAGTQVVGRDRHAAFLAALALSAATLEADRARDPPPAADRGRRSLRTLRSRAEGLQRDAAQAQPGADRARLRPGPRGPRLRRHRPGERGPLARARHQPFLC